MFANGGVDGASRRSTGSTTRSGIERTQAADVAAAERARAGVPHPGGVGHRQVRAAAEIAEADEVPELVGGDRPVVIGARRTAVGPPHPVAEADVALDGPVADVPDLRARQRAGAAEQSHAAHVDGA